MVGFLTLVLLFFAGRLWALKHLRRNSTATWSDTYAKYTRRYHFTKGNALAVVAIAAPIAYVAHAVVLWVHTYYSTVVLCAATGVAMYYAVRRAWRLTRANVMGLVGQSNATTLSCSTPDE